MSDTTISISSAFAERLAITLHLLYGAHRRVVFDTPEDEALKEEVLAQARELLGFDPENVEQMQAIYDGVQQ